MIAFSPTTGSATNTTCSCPAVAISFPTSIYLPSSLRRRDTRRQASLVLLGATRRRTSPALAPAALVLLGATRRRIRVSRPRWRETRLVTRELDRIRKIALALPAVNERVSHGEPCFFVRGKRPLCYYHDNHNGDG